MAGAAVLAIVAAQFSGRLLARLGPVRVVPDALRVERGVVPGGVAAPRLAAAAAAALLYVHSTVLGAIAISSFWSLLNERFDPHSAKPLMARVAAAATFGGFVGGVSAERVAALSPQGTLLPLLGLVGVQSVSPERWRSEGARRPAAPAPATSRSGRGCWAQFQRQPLLRDLALVVALAAMLAALADYLLKAEAVALFRKRSAAGALLRTVLRGHRPRPRC